ncbi:protein yellow [Aplysia californica]|uniref:Protein yellow n=1 Tax=Aplysia californica TaxID=6500 RepID=A0ABM1A9K4_APLCA|nr:protein yellow [Aplysia californica]
MTRTGTFSCYFIMAALVLLGPACMTSAVQFGDASLVYQWSALDFVWTSEQVKEEFIKNGSFIVDKNLLAGIKVYKSQVYLTIPRWRTLTGFPVTLAKVVEVQGQHKLSPYPDWASQTIGDCQALQYIQSMEIDPNTGHMYVIDTGRIGLASPNVQPQNLCPAKIVVYDLNTDQQTASYEIPADVVSRDKNFMNDIVLDYVDGKVRYAYISDVAEAKLHIYDFETKTGRNLVDEASMQAEADGSIITINDVNYTFAAGIDGIAMSPDFDYVYYCPLGGYNLYQVPTSTLRNGGTSGIRLLGRKVSQSDGLVYSSKRLYYGGLGTNAVYFWNSEKDTTDQNVDIGQANLTTQTQLVQNDETMQWPDTFAIDEEGWLWFVSNRLHLFSTGTMNLTGSEVNMRVWKVFINETSYLHGAHTRTASRGVGLTTAMTAIYVTSVCVVVSVVCRWW